MRVSIQDDQDAIATFVANYCAEKIKDFTARGEMLNIICPVGWSPFGVYKLLGNMVESGELTFKNVRVFQMDEVSCLGCC